MTPPDYQDDHDLLVGLHAKFDALQSEFRRVSNGTGFPRCAERLARHEALEEEVKSLRNRLWWALTTGISAGVGLLISLLKGGLGI